MITGIIWSIYLLKNSFEKSSLVYGKGLVFFSSVVLPSYASADQLYRTKLAEHKNMESDDMRAIF